MVEARTCEKHFDRVSVACFVIYRSYNPLCDLTPYATLEKFIFLQVMFEQKANVCHSRRIGAMFRCTLDYGIHLIIGTVGVHLTKLFSKQDGRFLWSTQNKN